MKDMMAIVAIIVYSEASQPETHFVLSLLLCDVAYLAALYWWY
jgi:hypothetical protein